jgi:arsenate reductase (thioredoxin)
MWFQHIVVLVTYRKGLMNILFMCVANSARSQLAEGLARVMFPKAKICSAGSKPGTLNAYAVEAMQEVGIDISDQFSKSCDDLPKKFIANLDYVITLCAEEVCPIVQTKAKKLHWPFPDPATTDPLSEDELLRRFRNTRDLIKKALSEFKIELHR